MEVAVGEGESQLNLEIKAPNYYDVTKMANDIMKEKGCSKDEAMQEVWKKIVRRSLK